MELLNGIVDRNKPLFLTLGVTPFVWQGESCHAPGSGLSTNTMHCGKSFKSFRKVTMRNVIMFSTP